MLRCRGGFARENLDGEMEMRLDMGRDGIDSSNGRTADSATAAQFRRLGDAGRGRGSALSGVVVLWLAMVAGGEVR